MERLTAIICWMNICVKGSLIVRSAGVRLRETAFNASTMNSLNHGTTHYRKTINYGTNRYQLPKLCFQVAQKSSTLLVVQFCAIRDQNVKNTVTNVNTQIHLISAEMPAILTLPWEIDTAVVLKIQLGSLSTSQSVQKDSMNSIVQCGLMQSERENKH